MEEFGPLLSYQESADDLKQKLLYAALELETVKMEANEALRKHTEEIKNLLNLVKIACQERDEAKDQLQKLLNKLVPSSPTELNPSIRRYSKSNSSTTESNSLSETYNPESHISSPVNSFFDAVSSSPELSNIKMAADSSNLCGFVKQPFIQAINGSMSTGLVSDTATSTAVIDSIAMGKALPQKGKLLQAVMEAGPLLKTLLVAGQLPRWRNPPPLQDFKFPHVPINQKPAANSSCVAQKSLNSSSYLQMSWMSSSQMCSTSSILNFSSCPAGSRQRNGMLLTSGAGMSTQKLSGKRQRFH